MGNILVVEDDPAIRTCLSVALEFEGYQVALASNGREGLETLKKMKQPSLVILDLLMPQMTGEEFLQVKRSDPAFSKVPVIVLSAQPGRAKKVTAEAVLAKPVELEDFLSAVNKHMPIVAA